MSEHSIEELTRQFKQADSRAKQACVAREDARKRLVDARIKAALSEKRKQGIVPGAKVWAVVRRVDGSERRRLAVFGGYREYFNGATIIEPFFTKVKANGEPGKAKSNIGCVDRIEPYDGEAENVDD